MWKVRMFNAGGELEMRTAATADEAKAQLIEMIEMIDLYDGDRFEISQVELPVKSKVPA